MTLTDWLTRVKHIVILLQASLIGEELLEVVGLSTAHDIRVALETASMERVQNLRVKIFLLSKGTLTISDFGRRFKEICD